MTARELVCRALARAFAGREGKARATLSQIEHLGRTRFVSQFALALGYTALGDHNEAINWLERDRDQRSGWIGLLNHDPRVDPLRGNPRFEAIRALAGHGNLDH